MSSSYLRRRLPSRPNHDALQRIYRAQALGIPGPVDRWIVTNLRAGRSLNFLQNYMYLVDVDCTRNVRCRVERKMFRVSTTPLVRWLLIISPPGNPGRYGLHQSSEIRSISHMQARLSLSSSLEVQSKPAGLFGPLRRVFQRAHCTRLGQRRPNSWGISSAAEHHRRDVCAVVDVGHEPTTGACVTTIQEQQII
jgi:hypothetical protein